MKVLKSSSDNRSNKVGFEGFTGNGFAELKSAQLCFR